MDPRCPVISTGVAAGPSPSRQRTGQRLRAELGRDRARRRARGSASARRSIENASARASPDAARRSASAPVGQHARERRGERRRVARRARAARRGRRSGHVAVAREVARHDRRARPPSPRAARRRTTRRRSDGAQNTSAPCSRRGLLLVGDPPEPLDRGVAGEPGLQRPRSPDRRRRPTSATSGGRLRHRLEQHVQALARLVAAEEEDRRAVGRRRRGLREAVDLDAVERAGGTRRRVPRAPARARPRTPRTARSSRLGNPPSERA